MIRGPGGIPLVVDPIHGVFYASHVAVLMDKLQELGVAFETASQQCRTGIVGTFERQSIYLAAFAALLLAAAGVVVVYRPRRLVKIVVNCGEYVDDCAQAVERAVRRLRSDDEDNNEVVISDHTTLSKRQPDEDPPPDKTDEDRKRS